MAIRDFENIPGASKPAQQSTLGRRDKDIDLYLADQIQDPEIADKAKQKYTKQDVQADELMTTPTQAGITTAGQQTVTAPGAITAQTGTTTATGAPSALAQRTMTAATVGTPTAATAATQTGLGASTQVTGQTRGTVTGAATAATAIQSQFRAQSAKRQYQTQREGAKVIPQSDATRFGGIKKTCRYYYCYSKSKLV